MSKYLLRRVGTSLLTVFGIVVVVFFIVRVLPGDAAAVRAGPYANQELIDRIADKYGLNDPILVQFADYMSGVAQGDLGVSIRTNQGVTGELLDRLPASLELAVYSVVLATLVGVSLGVLAAYRQATWVDRFARIFAVVGSAMALFWLGLLLTFFLAFQWKWFPGPVDRLAIGSEDPRTFTGFYTIDGFLSGRPEIAWEAFRYLALPVITLAFVLAAPILKMVRSAMIEALDSDFVRTAKAMGVPRRQILFVDGFRNALIPVTTTIGIVFGFMIGGNILVEFLFSWPGIGRYAFDAITTRDLEALQGFVVFVGVMYVVLNMAIDIAYALIDPRIRLGSGTAK
ncbi:MAG: ABC transporter permease [Acidimicrobiales bacterium]|nr:ABC transporter permease [Acidimicrobiales bacterium]